MLPIIAFASHYLITVLLSRLACVRPEDEKQWSVTEQGIARKLEEWMLQSFRLETLLIILPTILQRESTCPRS